MAVDVLGLEVSCSGQRPSGGQSIFVVVALLPADQSRRAGDEGANDERQRPDQGKGCSGLARAVRGLCGLNLGLVYALQHVIHPRLGIWLRQSGARGYQLRKIGTICFAHFSRDSALHEDPARLGDGILIARRASGCASLAGSDGRNRASTK